MRRKGCGARDKGDGTGLATIGWAVQWNRIQTLVFIPPPSTLARKYGAKQRTHVVLPRSQSLYKSHPPHSVHPGSLSVELKCVHSWYVRCIDDSTRRSPDNHSHVQVPDPRCSSCNGTFVEMASCIFRLQILGGRQLITSVVAHTDRKHPRRPQNFP